MTNTDSPTTIILTYNESVNIQGCLKSLSWVRDIVIVDSYSDDNTVELARDERPDVRIFQHSFENFGQQRNWALEHTRPKHEWILFLDADERCTAECSAAVREHIARPEGNIGFYMTYRNYFLGRWIKHCTMYPSWQLRLLKHGEVRYEKAGHGQKEVTDGALGYIHEPYNHYGFSKGLHHWVDRHNRYSTEEAAHVKQLRQKPLDFSKLIHGNPLDQRRQLKRLAARLELSRPVVRFLYLYIFRRGFLDGREGLIYCLLSAAQQTHIIAKIEECQFRDERGTSNR